MAAETDERAKRRKYTTAERMKILEAVEEVGVAEAARGHGVPQTTVSNWLHRDATKVAKEKAAHRAAVRAGGSKGSRKRRGPTTMATAETAGLIAAATVATAAQVEASNAATAAPQVEVSNGMAAAKAPKAAKVKTEPEVAKKAKEAKPVAVLPKPGTVLPNSLIKRVARSYTPSEKAVALEHAAAHGVSAAADKLGISRFSIYDWQRKVAKAAAGEGPSRRAVRSPKRSRSSGIERSSASGGTSR